MYIVAVSVFAYAEGGAGGVAVVSLIRIIPAAIVAPFAAVLSDRFHRERVMLFADITRTVALIGAGLVVAFSLPAGIVYALAALVSMLSTTFRPAQSALRFDDQDEGARPSLPPLELQTPSGAAFALRGRIDRVDLLPEGRDAAVFDYRLGSKTLSLQQVYHGLSLQLLTSLLALHAGGRSDGKPLRPAAAFYLQMARGMGEVSHPSEALDPSDPRHLLRVKPRGVFDGSYLPALDASLEVGASEVVQVQINKDGNFGRRGSSDVAEPAQFRGLLAHVSRKLGELAVRLLAGDSSCNVTVEAGRHLGKSEGDCGGAE